MRHFLYATIFVSLCFCSTSACAEIVGTGTFEQVFPPIAPPPNPNFWTGTLAFDDQPFDVQGQPVNMGTAVGTMDLDGFIEEFPLLNELLFDYSAVSQAAGVFAFDHVGFLACPNCQQPQGAAFSGFLDSVSGTLVGSPLPAAGPGVGTYAISGVVTCPTNECTGAIALDYFAAEATPTGTDVAVPLSISYYNPITTTEDMLDVDVEFDEVTGAGGTVAASIWTITGTVPPELSLDADGFEPALFDLATSASFTGSVAVCVSYADDDDDGLVDGTTVLEGSLRLLHDEGGSFVDRTDTVDTTANKVCGLVTSFSEFATAVDLSAISCPAAPQPACIGAAQAKLDVNEKKTGKEKLKLQWKGIAAETTAGDFGNPTTGNTSVALCVYDEQSSLAGEILVDRGSQPCAGIPCWEEKGSKGYGYKDKTSSADGVSKIGFVSGPASKGRADAKGKNNASKGQASLPVGIASALQGSATATLQMITSDGFCAGATTTRVIKDEGTRYKADAK